MDDILYEMGTKWNTISKDQQVALAQTVAGTRQYTQLMALMNNFDFYLENLNRAQNSDGALQKQADIYAESWEASQKRVKAAMEEVYTDLIDDDFFIGLNDALAGFIGLLDNLLKSMGGAKGLLTGVSSILLNMFAGQAAQGLENMVYNFESFIGIAQKKAMTQKEEMFRTIDEEQAKSTDPVHVAELEGMKQQNILERELLGIKENLTEQEAIQAQEIIKQNQAYKDQLVALAEVTRERQADVALASDAIDTQIMDADYGAPTSSRDMFYSAEDVLVGLEESASKLDIGDQISEELQQAAIAFRESRGDIETYEQALDQLAEKAQNAGLHGLADYITNDVGTGENHENRAGIQKRTRNLVIGGTESRRNIIDEDVTRDIQNRFVDENNETIVGEDEARDYVTRTRNLKTAIKEEADANKALAQSTQQAKQRLQELGNTHATLATTVVNTAQAAMSFSFAISSLKSLGSTWADDSIGAGEKLLQTFTSLGMAIPMLMNSWKGLNSVLQLQAQFEQILTAVTQQRIDSAIAELGTEDALAVAKRAHVSLDQAIIACNNAKAVSALQNLGISEAEIAAMTAEQLVEKTGMTLDQAAIVLSALKNGANLTEAMSEAGLTAAKGASTAATIAQTVANWGLLASMPPLLAITLVLVAAIAAIAAIVWIVVKAFQAWKASTPEAQLEELEEQTQKATEAFERMSEKINEVKSAFDNLDNSYQTLENLTEGTLEWKQAVSDVNAEVLKLLDVYPELGQYLQSSNGILSFSDEGKKNINDKMAVEYSQAENAKISAQIRENNKKLEIGKNSYIDPYEGLGVTAPNWDKTFSTMQKAYENTDFGEALFSDFGAKAMRIGVSSEALKGDLDYNSENLGQEFTDAEKDAFIESLANVDWGDPDALRKLAEEKLGNNFEAVNFEELSEDLLYQQETMRDIIDANEENIRQQANLSKVNDELAKAQYENTLKSLGSNRTAEEGKELLDKDYETYKTEAKNEITAKVNKGGLIGWKDHSDYTGNEDWIQEFMKLQGADKYVAQRKGKMVLEINGEEKEFSREEVINGLIDSQATKNMADDMENALRTSVEGAFANMDTSKLNLEQLTNLDNFQLNLKHSLSDTFSGDELQSKIQSITSAIGQAYGDLETFSDSVQYIDFNDEDISNKLIKLSTELQDDTEAYKEELNKINELGKIDSLASVFENAASAMGGSKDEIAETSQEMQTYAKRLMAVSKNSDILSQDLETNADAAADVAIATTKMNKGIDKLAGGIKDWSSILTKSSKESAEYSKAMTDIKEAMEDVLGVSSDFLSDDFIVQNMKDIEKAAQGDANAIDRLAIAAGRDILVHLDFEDEQIKQDVLNLHESLVADIPDIKIGAKLEDGEFLANAQELVNTAGMTAEEAQAYFNSIGYEPEFVTENKTVKREVPQERTHTDYAVTPGTINIGGIDVPFPTIDRISTTTITGYKEMDETIQVPALSSDGTPQIKSLTKKSSGAMNNYSSRNSGGSSPSGSGSKGGGGGSKGKTTQAKAPVKAKKKEDEIERYHEINEVIEDQEKIIDRLNKKKDDLYGADRLKAMDEEIAANKTLIKQNQQLLDEAKQNLALDKQNAADYGITFDEQGRINNYDEIIQQKMDEWLVKKQAAEDALTAYEERKNASDNYDADGREKLALDEASEAVDEEYEDFKNAISQYEETYDLVQEVQDGIDDKIREIQQLNYEKLEYKLEIRVELNESDLSDIEHQMSRLSENDYTKSAERITLVAEQTKLYKLMVDDQKRQVEKLKELYAAGAISAEKFIEGLKNAKEAVQNYETSLKDAIQTVSSELENAIDLADEKLDKKYDEFDQQISFLEHYKNVMTLSNGEKDYASINKILDQQRRTTLNRVNSRMAELHAWEELYDELESRKIGGDILSGEEEARLEQLKGKISETKEELYSDIEQLGEYATEIFENSIEKAKQSFEEQLFDDTIFEGFTLEGVIESIERLQSSQELVLTTTNKIYETNKLIRNTEKDIEKTTNKRAKQAYQEFQNKVKQKQEQNELTQFELDLLTAEYEITKAQIALEEAQNAKDTVRLTRDSEGNFGYIYTANQDKVNEAEQALEDANNNLYNISKERAEAASAEWYQNIQDTEEALVTLEQQYAKGKITKTQYEEQQTEILNQSRKKQEQILKDYYLATDTMQANSFALELDYKIKSIGNMSDYDDAMETLVEGLCSSTEVYQTQVEDTADITTSEWGNVYTAVNKVNTESNNLQSTLINTLIPAMTDNLIPAIEKTTKAWEEQLLALEKVATLSDSLAGEQHDSMTKEVYQNDYAQQIKNLIETGDYSYDDEETQKLLSYRWDKNGGKDDTDYTALMTDYLQNGGKTTDSQYQLYEWLQKYKIQRTNWLGLAQEKIRQGASLESLAWIAEIRDSKTGGHDSQELIEDYYNKFNRNYMGELQQLILNGAIRNDETVQSLIADRDWKLEELGRLATTLQDLEEWAQANGIAFASGGYTGDWGPEGRMAILHEKELVLNADDTKNILTSVGIIREISKALDNSALWSALGMANLNASYIAAGGSDTLQQEVTIHADFPNVQDHNEIEMAIDNLINAASQYAYRN